ncbi:MAG: hypothetical protein M0R06_12835 [Sphaerochaeta sp.]|nr:hypothetical protein [Sphaerochaeta sp.]
MIRENAQKVLGIVCNILEAMEKPYWLDSGTVLSAYRDNDINIYDHDIDIRTPEQFWSSEDIGEFVKQLWLAGFSQLKDTGDARMQILAVHKDDVKLDFKFVYFDDSEAWYFCFGETGTVIHAFKRTFFDQLETIGLFGRQYPCPSPVQEYIEAHYGPDWRKFKVRASEAEWTDLSWDYMKDPPAAHTFEDFKKRKETVNVRIDRREKWTRSVT